MADQKKQRAPRPSCTVCQKPRAKWCTICRAAAYCSKECQVKDRRAHRPRCKPPAAAQAAASGAALAPQDKVGQEIQRLEARFQTLCEQKDVNAAPRLILEGLYLLRVLQGLEAVTKRGTGELRSRICLAMAQAYASRRQGPDAELWISNARRCHADLTEEDPRITELHKTIASFSAAEREPLSLQQILDSAHHPLRDQKKEKKDEPPLMAVAFVPAMSRTPAVLEEGLTWFHTKCIIKDAPLRVVLDASCHGYDVVATAPIAYGQPFFSEEPFVAASVDPNRCHHCLGQLPAAAFGSGRMHVPCRHGGGGGDQAQCEVMYCGKACEIMAWNRYHHLLCGRVQWSEFAAAMVRSGRSSSAKNGLVVLKCLGMTVGSPAIWQVPPLKYLMSWQEMGNVEQAFMSVETVGKRVMQAGGSRPGVGLDWTLEVMGRIMPNAFTIRGHTDEDNKTFAQIDGSGMACGTISSLFNHACDPNAEVVQSYSPLGSGLRLIVVARRDIPKGESIRISYLPDGLEQQQRQAVLEKLYGFSCRCSKCYS